MNSLEYNNNTNFIRKKINLAPKHLSNKNVNQLSKTTNFANNNNCHYGSRNFWRKHCLVVAIDVSEILDRVFCQCGLDQTLQEALTLTALDKRSFAPPIESNWQRVVNMANTCETFELSPGLVADLIRKGFRSVALLALASGSSAVAANIQDLRERRAFTKCLNALNDRRLTALEPLHSLRRLAHAKRKHLFSATKLDYLDLANVDLKRLPQNRSYKQPTPMIAKATFKTVDTHTIFGPLKACKCPPSLLKPREPLSSTSSSSGYSSQSDTPESSSSSSSQTIIIAPPLLPPARNYYGGRKNSFSKPPTTTKNCAKKNARVFCPYIDCNWGGLNLFNVEAHCGSLHQINSKFGAKVVTYKDNERKRLCGDVRLTVNALELLDQASSPLWWGPMPFTFDNATFYQIVYKKYDEVRSRPVVLFWIWAKLAAAEASQYRYEVHIEHPDLNNIHSNNHHYTGVVQSLETSASDVMKNNMRSLVYFSQSYLRRTHFSHNLAATPDIKYTVKIMRPSLYDNSF